MERLRSIAVAIAIFTFASPTFAAFGDVDTSFGTNGSFVFHTPPAGSNLSVYASVVLRQTDGKIIIVGRTVENGNPTKYYVIIKRYNSNGSIDLTYGNNGMARLQSGYGSPSSAALQSDGKLIVGGKHGNFNSLNAPQYVWRFTTDGEWDPTFGTNGRASLGSSIGSVDQISAIKTTSNASSQHIICVNEGTIKRLNSNGTINTTFGNSGSLTGLGDRFVTSNATAVSNSTISTAHFANGGGTLVLRSFDGNGQPTNAFGGSGMTLSFISTNSPQLRGFYRTPQGKFVTYGSICMSNCFNYQNYISVHSSTAAMEHSTLLPLSINQISVVRTNSDGTHIFPLDDYGESNAFEKYTSNLAPLVDTAEPSCRDVLIQPDSNFVCVDHNNVISRHVQH